MYPDDDLEAAYHAYGKTHFIRRPEGVKDADLKKALLFRRWLKKACKGRRIFLIRKGYLGLAPSTMDKGDVVALLAGGNTPYIVRPVKKDKYKLVGECYVHGIMHGQAWKAEGNKREVFII